MQPGTVTYRHTSRDTHRSPQRHGVATEDEMTSGNIVERLRAMAADLDQFRRDKVEDELSEAADVIELLRAELDRVEQLMAAAKATEPPAA